MGFLSGKNSDDIRGKHGGTVDINPGRPDMEKTKSKVSHEGHQLSPPNRKAGKSK